MKSALVSIIVPVYNVEFFLRDCVESVLAQDYSCWELLLVDDGSIDDSSKICDEYSLKDDRIRVYHKQNGGLSSARNYGLERATGKYVIFFDSDDFWIQNNSLSVLVSSAETFNADVVRGEYKEVDEKGNDLLMRDISCKRSKEAQILSSSVFYKEIINGENFSVLFLFNIGVFNHGLRFDENRCFEEDIELNIRLFSTNLRCVYVPLVFYAYRKRPNSIVRSYNINHLRDSFLLSDVFERYSYEVQDPMMKRIYQENAVMMYYWTLCSFIEDRYFKARHHAFKALRVSDFRKKALRRMFKHRMFNKVSLLICLPHNMSVILIYIRNMFLFGRRSVK